MELTLAEKCIDQALECATVSTMYLREGNLERGKRWGRVADAYLRKALKLMKGGNDVAKTQQG